MAFRTKTHGGYRPSENGQGAVEALITLPVFLVLSVILLQTALLCMGQILLHYAAFCTVRTGVVTNGELSEMMAAARAVLSPASRASSSGEQPFNVEILTRDELLQVRVTWDYPLVVPFAAKILNGISTSTSSDNESTIPLSASWALPMERIDSPDDGMDPYNAEL